MAGLLAIISLLVAYGPFVAVEEAAADVLLPDGLYNVSWDVTLDQHYIISNTDKNESHDRTAEYSGSARVDWLNQAQTTTVGVDTTYSSYDDKTSSTATVQCGDGTLQTESGTFHEFAVNPSQYAGVVSTIPMFRFQPFKTSDGTLAMHWPITDSPTEASGQNNGADPRFYTIHQDVFDSGACNGNIPPVNSSTNYQSPVTPWANLYPGSVSLDPALALRGIRVVLTDVTADASGTFVANTTFTGDPANPGRTVTAHIKIEPTTQNKAPVVSAGGPVTGHSRTPLNLSGNVTDDGLPNPPSQVSSQWSVASAPVGGTVSFGDPSTPATTATFSRPGHYVLKLSADDSQLSASATTTADIKDEYTLITQSWIPFVKAVDPMLTVPLKYAQEKLVPFEPDCYTPTASQAPKTTVSSTFRGDGHPGFDGSYRMNERTTFTWDGTSISGVSMTYGVGASFRDKSYYDAKTGEIFSNCFQTGVAQDVPTVTQISGDTIEAKYTGHLPLTPPSLTPGFLNDVLATVHADGSVDLAYAVTLFPEIGLRVLLNGNAFVTGFENDITCLTQDQVLGPAGAARVALGLGSQYEATATVTPDAPGTFAHRSGLCQ